MTLYNIIANIETVFQIDFKMFFLQNYVNNLLKILVQRTVFA